MILIYYILYLPLAHNFVRLPFFSSKLLILSGTSSGTHKPWRCERARGTSPPTSNTFFFLRKKNGHPPYLLLTVNTVEEEHLCVPPQCLLTMYKAISSLSGRCAALTRGSCSRPSLAYFHRASGEFSLLQLQLLPSLYKCVKLFGLLLLQCRRSIFQLIDSTIIIFFLLIISQSEDLSQPCHCRCLLEVSQQANRQHYISVLWGQRLSNCGPILASILFKSVNEMKPVASKANSFFVDD